MGKHLIPLGIAFTICSLFISACASASPTVSSTSIVVIEYSRTGGIAGFNDNLKIDSKGHATLKRRNANVEFDLTVDELNQLQSSLVAANFSSIAENSMPKALVPDELSYLIAYQGHRVATSDTAMPSALQPVVSRLNNIIDRGAK